MSGENDKSKISMKPAVGNQPPDISIRHEKDVW